MNPRKQNLIPHSNTTQKDLVTIEQTDSRDAVNYKKGDKNYPRQHNFASDSNAEAPHWSQKYVNTPKLIHA